jgi:hypothetical protein
MALNIRIKKCNIQYCYAVCGNNPIMLSIVATDCHEKVRYGESHYDECRGAEMKAHL